MIGALPIAKVLSSMGLCSRVILPLSNSLSAWRKGPVLELFNLQGEPYSYVTKAQFIQILWNRQWLVMFCICVLGISMSTDQINAQGGILQKVETTNGFSHTSPGKKHRTSVETIYINVYIYYICVCAHFCFKWSLCICLFKKIVAHYY